MKFEEILPLLREGKKARLPWYDINDEYWEVGYISIFPHEEKFLTLHRFITINNTVIKYANNSNLGQVAVMSDKWEIVE